MRLIVCNSAWMNYYQGINRRDFPVHGGSFIERHGFGHEILNFKPNNRYVYGYVHTRTGSINIDRLGAGADDGFVDGILVVWRARSPEGSVIVGWYRNARIYRYCQAGNSRRRVQHGRRIERLGWYIRARRGETRLIPSRLRTFTYPATNPGFSSTSFVSFLDSDLGEVDRYRHDLLNYVRQIEAGRGPTGGRRGRTNVDQERNQRIERTAMREAISLYTDRGFDVKSVESENLGYDLVARGDSGELLVEVKGTSVQDVDKVSVGFTPNEYRASKRYARKYRICIVNNALGRPKLREFQWDSRGKSWIDPTTRSCLILQIIQAANAQIGDM